MNATDFREFCDHARVSRLGPKADNSDCSCIVCCIVGNVDAMRTHRPGSTIVAPESACQQHSGCCGKDACCAGPALRGLIALREHERLCREQRGSHRSRETETA